MKYPVVIYPCQPEGGFVSEILALPGCLAQGETLEECLDELEVVTKLWVETAAGLNITLPDVDLAIEQMKNFNQTISV